MCVLLFMPRCRQTLARRQNLTPKKDKDRTGHKCQDGLGRNTDNFMMPVGFMLDFGLSQCYLNMICLRKLWETQAIHATIVL